MVVNISHMLSQLVCMTQLRWASLKPMLGFPQTSPHLPFFLADFALYSFTVINHGCMIVCCPMSPPTEPSEIWGWSWGSTQHTMKCHKCRPNPFFFFFLLAKPSELLKFWRGYWSSHKRRTQFLRLYAYGHVNEHNAL